MPPSPSIEPKLAIGNASKVTGDEQVLSQDLNVNGVYLAIAPAAARAS
jgi:hypothetical protein